MYDIYHQFNRPGVLDPSGVLNSTVSQAFGLLPAQNVIPLDLQQIIRQRQFFNVYNVIYNVLMLFTGMTSLQRPLERKCNAHCICAS